MLVWMNQGPTLQGDFLSVALIEGKPELSYNLGKKTKPVRITSEVKFRGCNYLVMDDNSFNRKTGEIPL